jgi:soluble lytic murein transglycosylase
MAAMGLRTEAASALNNASSAAGPWRLLTLMRQAHGLGLTDVSARLAVRLREATAAAEAGIPVSLLRLEYSLRYVTLLNQEALSAGLDPLFVAAMVRQESFWDPLAGSRAGALGLTQVIPATGEGIAGALGVEGFKPEDLFRPSVSLRFGIYYLGGQLKRFGNPYAALAAYNAGPGNAIRWVDAAPGSRAADFVEAIDIGETHDYVERVMDHYAHYLYAYGGSQ